MSIEWRRIPIGRRRFMQGASALGLAAALPGALAPRAIAATGGTLKARSYSDWDTVDPAYSTGVTEEEVHALIYEKLIAYKPGRSWDWQLQAAESIEQPDALHINFALKSGVGWSNGYGALTAEDVKFSFERIVDEKVASPNKPDMGPLDRVDVHDERSGTIVFKEPFQPIWTIALPYITGNIVCKKAVEEAGGRLAAEAPTVAGPYRIRSHEVKAKTVLERNPDYAGAKRGFDEIEIHAIDDEKTAEIAFESGDLDFTRISLSSLESLKDNAPAGSTIEEFPSLYYVWVGMNLENEQLKDPRVRQAVQYAIDVPSIMEGAYFGVAQPSTGIIAPGLLGHREKSMIPPVADLEKAKALIQEAGADGITLTLDVLNKQTNVAAAQIIQYTASQAGINIEVNLHESGAFWTLGDQSAGERWKDIQLILNRFSMTPDPYYATAWFTTDQVGVWNWERFSNAEFDKLHEAAKGETDNAKRAAMYEKMQDMMEESGAYRFITHEAAPVIYRDSIKPALRPDGLPLYRDFEPA